MRHFSDRIFYGYGRCAFSLKGKASSPTKQYLAFAVVPGITMRQIECLVLEGFSERRIIEYS